MNTMISSSSILPLLFLFILRASLTSALVEFDPSGPAEVEYVHPSITAKEEKMFSRPNSLTVEGFAANIYEALEDEKGGKVMIETGTGKISSLILSDAIIPGKGRGNRLLWSVGTAHDEGHGPLTDHRVLSDVVVESVKGWIEQNIEAIQIDMAELGEERSAVHGGGEHVQVIIRRMYKGVPVEGSQAHAEISQGNIITFGLMEWAEISSDFNVFPAISSQTAKEAVAKKTGYPMTGGETCEAELKIITISANHRNQGQGNRPNRLFRGMTINNDNGQEGQGQGPPPFAQAYLHKLVWEVCPTLEGQTIEKFVAQVDAETGEVYLFKDSNDYLEAKGGVYPISNDGIVPDGVSQAGWPMPFMTIGGSTTDVGGNFEGGGTAVMEGAYLKINDNCGSASLPVSGNGIDWGTSGGKDCDTPGFGGSGNTHASRTTYYETNIFADQARRRLPTNPWLQQKLTAKLNIDSTCNAFWNGSVNFYKSGGGCANTGEISGVIDHEFAHGIDKNDVDMLISSPSGEGIADVYAALRLGTSCIGRNFVSTNCSGNGDPCTSCTGVRDIDFKRRQSGSRHTYSWSYEKCGGSVHCKGHVYSEAIWSLYKRKLQDDLYGYDDLTALEITTRLTYIAAGVTSTWFTGGPPNGFHGCNGSSGYRNFLAADDDDGDLTNGTPHMSAIYEAFNDQEIACDDLAVQDSGCPNLPNTQPIVTTDAGNKRVRLEWQSVDNASGYEVLRSDGGVLGCAQGKALLTTDMFLGANTTTTAHTFWEDDGLQNGREYCYIVVPKGSAGSCYGPASAATLATPISGPDFNVVCPSEELTFVKDSPDSQVVTCIVQSSGYSGTLSLNATTQMGGLSSTVNPASVTISEDAAQTVLVMVTSTHQVMKGKRGYVTVSAVNDDSARSDSIGVLIQVGDGAKEAKFDSTYKAPRCSVVGSSCSTMAKDSLVGSSILNGRGNNIGPEKNFPNTLDECTDGNSGSYHVDESIDAITVRQGKKDVQASQNMVEGGTVTVEALVYCWSNGSSDFADFYYTSDPSSPSWTWIETVRCPSGGAHTLAVDYDLPSGTTTHAVRVNFRYQGSQSSCSTGSYDDTDDLVFTVQSSSTLSPSSSPSLPPSAAPSQALTVMPISPPTAAPTSASPSRTPTNLLTFTPSAAPTSAVPTSAAPTTIPTSPQSAAPSMAPSRSPATLPTLTPSAAPSMAPSRSPTVSPTSPPSAAPSMAPSRSPTYLPTSTPSAAPSMAPTRSPTVSPTSPPSAAPSMAPSRSPTVSPTTPPSAAPSMAPSRSPTVSPTSPPSAAPSMAPSRSPTYLPTSTPSAAPSMAPSRSPTNLPTFTPSAAPTRSPIVKPTSPPSAAPSKAPSRSPTTNEPTPSIGDIAELQDAAFDTEYGVPRCTAPGSACDSKGLLNGRGTIANGVEANRSNTNFKGNECIDGNTGSYHADESIDQIIVTAGDIDKATGTPIPSNDFIVEGGRAYVSVKVWCWSTGLSDIADIYLTDDADTPDWKHLVSITCPGGGEKWLRHAFDVPQGILNQMIRVNFRYLGSQTSCSNGGYDDHDDLGFTVKRGSGPRTAIFHQALRIPKCSAGASCDSGDLLDGRGPRGPNNGPELNQPNTLNSACTDGISGAYHVDESIDKIIVSSESGGDLTEGEIAIITAIVWCWGDGTSDSADFYYASDASNPTWTLIGRIECPGGGKQTLTMSYALPQGGAIQAVRVNLMYLPGTPGPDKCINGDWNDTDDLAITVKSNSNTASLRGFVAAPSKSVHEQGTVTDESIRGAAEIEADKKKHELLTLMKQSEKKPKRDNGGEDI